MQVHYDKETDAIYLRIVDRPVVASEEGRPGIVLDLDERGEVVAIEVRGRRDSVTPPTAAAAQDEDDLPAAKTPVGVAVRAARARLRAEGVPFLSAEEFEREIAERRGLPPEQRLQ
jgi:uncharacterized protein YuzE